MLPNAISEADIHRARAETLVEILWTSFLQRNTTAERVDRQFATLNTKFVEAAPLAAEQSEKIDKLIAQGETQRREQTERIAEQTKSIVEQTKSIAELTSMIKDLRARVSEHLMQAVFFTRPGIIAG
ncbi:hypothetical protein HKX48_001146, partial [Thoreauomyces humboldtii]